MKRLRRYAILAGGVLFCSAAAAAQSRATLETAVTGQGDSIFLKWTKRHQWDSALVRGGPLLVAEYRIAGGRLVTDCLVPDGGAGCRGVAPVGDPTGRSLRYLLPRRLAAQPIGPVCLAFLWRDSRAFPIRRVGGEARGTSRFRHEEWEQATRSATERIIQEQNLIDLRDSLAQVEAKLVAAANSPSSPEGCQAMRTPVLGTTGGARRPVEENPAKWPLLAELVCISRVRSAEEGTSRWRGYARLRDSAAHSPSLLDSLVRLLPPSRRDALRRLRGAQLDEYRSAWENYAPVVREYGRQLEGAQPHFGSIGDLIRLPTMAAGHGRDIADASGPGAGLPMSAQDAIGPYVGATLDAYQQCVTDGIEQMRLASEAAATLERQDSTVQERARMVFVKECEVRVNQLLGLKARRDSLQRKVAEVEQALRALPSATAFGSQATPLNERACTT